MSRLSAVTAALGKTVTAVLSKREVVNGEPGETILVERNGRRISIHFADNRKVSEDDAVRIVRSYLSRIGVPHDPRDTRYR